MTAIVTAAPPHVFAWRAGTAGFLNGCNCRECAAGYEETVDMRVALTDGATLETVGWRHGLTKERVRQRIVQAYGPGWMTRLRAAQRFARLPGNGWYRQHVQACSVCAVPYQARAAGTPRACSDPACRHAWINGLMYHCQPGRQAANRRHVARWDVAHPDSIPDFQVRDSIRVLSGQQARYDGRWAGRPRRWLQPGSVGWKAARRAWVRGGAAADMLPAEVADRAFADLRAAPVVDRWALAHADPPARP